MIAEHTKDTELINGVIHEIKNPISIIKANVDLISLNCSDYSNQFNIINKQLNYIEELTCNYLTTFKDIEYKVINLDEIIDNILFEYENSYKNIQFNFSCNNIINIRGDYKLLIILFKNMLKNAVESIKLKEDENLKFLGEIFIKITLENEDVIINIVDNGIGLDESRNLNGNGIGLKIIKKIVEIHNGKFHIYNNFNLDGVTQKIVF